MQPCDVLGKSRSGFAETRHARSRRDRAYSDKNIPYDQPQGANPVGVGNGLIVFDLEVEKSFDKHPPSLTAKRYLF